MGSAGGFRVPGGGGGPRTPGPASAGRNPTAAGPHGGGGSGSRAVGASTSAPTVPASKSRATPALPGTASGNLIGGKSGGRATPPPGTTNEHHDIVQKAWNPGRNKRKKRWWAFSKETQDYFDSKTITVRSRDHKYSTAHRAYNTAVRAAIKKHLAGPPKVDPTTMGLEGAKALYRAVMRDPDVRAFRKKMLESNESLRKQYPMWMDGR